MDPAAHIHDMAAVLARFTIPQIISLASVVTAPLRREVKRNRSTLLQYIQTLPDNQRIQFVLHAQTATTTRRRRAPEANRRPAKRPRVEREVEADSENELEVGRSRWSDSNITVEDLIAGNFLRPVESKVTEDCIARVIDRTSNAALAKAPCMSCARLLFLHDMYTCKPEDIPNPVFLQPTHPHPRHELTNGMLLCRSNRAEEYICYECSRALVRGDRPALSLSNNMWIGEVLLELSVLGLAERLLVSRYFPAAFIIKLFPRQLGRAADETKATNQALRGNVSSYKLNPDRIAEMVTGNILPHPTSLLAATIGVTFVGAKKQPVPTFPEMVYVQRHCVVAALRWLKEHNPLYANVHISDLRAGDLPENGVPDAIANNARFSDDVGAVQAEHATYVPDEEESDEESADEFQEDEEREHWRGQNPGRAAVGTNDDEDEEDDEDDDVNEPDVFPIQAHGVIDTVGDEVTDNDLLRHGAENIVSHTVAREYGIRKGNAFVNEYARTDDKGRRFDGGPENPNHMLGTFPFLFPYGLGGFEVDREVKVPYETHLRWALQYVDKRFRKDIYFVFSGFSVSIRRQMCRAAALQIKRSSFVTLQTSFQCLQPTDFVRAGEEEAQRRIISNPVVRALRKQVVAVRSKVPGTDESRIAIRGQIWGMTLRFNPPTIWATLNLSDSGDPIAQVLAGEEIDLDAFVSTAGPGRKRRSRTVANDPFAAAEFFHVTVRVILEELFGFTAAKRRGIERRPGVLGLVNGYIGTVEAQARGSLHLHILFWLADAPTAQVMKDGLRSETFRARVRAFIAQNIKAHLSENDENLEDTPKARNIAYSRPEDPRLPDYARRRDEAERRIARVTQPHHCTNRSCMRVRNGRVACKRRAPWPTAEEPWIKENGEWGPKRVWGRLNGWNPPLMQVGRCNSDMKLITNGGETKDISFYITLYIAKKQIQAANASALLAKAVQMHHLLSAREKRDVDENKLLLQRCANVLSRQQELSGPEVVSYVMGWGDRFLSHSFVRIYCDEATWALRQAYPRLAEKSPELEKEPAARIAHENGQFVLKDQLKEYTDRGHELDATSMYDYHTFTYHGKMLQTEREDNSDDTEDEGREPRRGAGRPASERVPYTDSSQRKGCRVFRATGMETVVHLVGRWLPRSDDPNREYYSAQVLMLLKPWRALRDLRGSHTTFSDALTAFLTHAPAKVHDIIDNLQYFHDCTDAANVRREEARLEARTSNTALSETDLADAYANEREEPGRILTEDDVEVARQNRYATREFLFGKRAMDVAYRTGVFSREHVTPERFNDARRATHAEAQTYQEWSKKVAEITRKNGRVNNSAMVQPDVADVVEVDGPLALDGDGDVVDMGDPRARHVAAYEETLQMLNTEQRLAHDIVYDHLHDTLQGRNPRQLLMIVQGEGGTGKTVLINTISRLFDSLGQADSLAKTATTGVAASLIGGQTVHSWAGIPLDDNRKPSEETEEKRKRNILPTRYLLLDEFSMMTKKVLKQLERIMSETKSHDGLAAADVNFGGVNVILFGDPHQFPPPGNPTGALYHTTDHTEHGLRGLQKYQQFTTVVTLTKQMRMRDPGWMGILRRLRTGSCTADDVHEVQKLLLEHPECAAPDFQQAPWNAAVLVTPRHGARVQWNSACLDRHACNTGNRVYVCPAEDIVARGKRPLTMHERVVVASLPQKKSGKLDERVEISVGMRAMVLFNIATEADLANGTRGEIIDIRLDPREPPLTDTADQRVILKHPPAVVLFKPDTCSFEPFEGLPPGVLPIVPSTVSFVVPSTGPTSTQTIKRRQYAMTPGYAFTDYKSQGQTLEYVLIDLADPPSGHLTLFSAYVALSRSRGRDNIRLLRGFNTDLFTTHPSEMLRKEDERLARLTTETAAHQERIRHQRAATLL